MIESISIVIPSYNESENITKLLNLIDQLNLKEINQNNFCWSQ